MSEKQLIYSSLAVGNIADTTLQVVERAAMFNLSRRITGVLAVDGRAFAQVLEGRSSDVDSLMERIARDPRHRQLRIVSEHPSSVRLWPNWQLCLAAPTAANAPIFRRYGIAPDLGKSLAELEPALLTALLLEFSEHAMNNRRDSKQAASHQTQH